MSSTEPRVMVRSAAPPAPQAVNQAVGRPLFWWAEERGTQALSWVIFRPSVRSPKVAFLVEFGQIWMKFDEIRFPFVDFPLLFQKQALFAIFDRFSPFLFRKRALFIKSRHISPKSPQNYPKLPKSRLIRHQSTRKSLNSPPNYP